VSDEPKNRFARMMEVAREHQAADAARPEEEVKEPPLQTTVRSTSRRNVAKSGRGRPATGKRSDPAYESTTVFLRRETKLAAGRLLFGDKHQDLSDVLEKLLSGWVSKNS
jgi:hypothetical protein